MSETKQYQWAIGWWWIYGFNLKLNCCIVARCNEMREKKKQTKIKRKVYFISTHDTQVHEHNELATVIFQLLTIMIIIMILSLRQFIITGTIWNN